MTEIFKSKITFIDDLCCGTVLVRKLNDLSWANQALECFFYIFLKQQKLRKYYSNAKIISNANFARKILKQIHNMQSHFKDAKSKGENEIQ